MPLTQKSFTIINVVSANTILVWRILSSFFYGAYWETWKSSNDWTLRGDNKRCYSIDYLELYKILD